MFAGFTVPSRKTRLPSISVGRLAITINAGSWFNRVCETIISPAKIWLIIIFAFHVFSTPASTLALLMVLLTLYQYVIGVHFMFEMYVFMMVISHLVQLMDLRFDSLVADQKNYLAPIYTHAVWVNRLEKENLYIVIVLFLFALFCRFFQTILRCEINVFYFLIRVNKIKEIKSIFRYEMYIFWAYNLIFRQTQIILDRKPITCVRI